jgi:hypothetical protein
MEERINFPVAYLEMEAKGWFDVSSFTKRDDISETGYVWFNEIIWKSKSKILSYNRDDFANDRLIPFARNGGGDLWVWINSLDQAEMEILFCPKNEMSGFYYAPNFIGAIFRQIFEFSSTANFYVDAGASWQMPLDIARKHLLNWIEKFSLYMPDHWKIELNKLLNADLFLHSESNESYYVIIDPREADNIVRTCLKYDKYDEELSDIWK